MQTTTNSLFKFLCLAVAVSLASALQLNAPLPAPNFNGLVTDGAAIISWTAETGDPAAISLEIQNDVTLDSFEIAHNVLVSQGSVRAILDGVPGGNEFFLQAVNPTNVLDVYAVSPTFTVYGEVPAVTNA